MIIYPPAFPLSAPVSINHARIGHQSWARGLGISAVTASSETEDGPRDMPLREDTYSFWEPESVPATYLVDLGALRDVDYVGLLGTFGSSGNTVEVETSTGVLSGSPLEQTWVPFSDSFAPGDDSPIMLLDDSRTTRYLRISIEGGSAPRLMVLYVGEVLAMQRMIYGGHSPLNLARDTELDGSMSQGGQFLGQGFRRLGVKGSASFRHLTASWYRENFDPFVKDARKYPYFFAWRPGDFSEEAAFVWTREDIQPQNMGTRDFMQVQVPMRGVGHAD